MPFSGSPQLCGIPDGTAEHFRPSQFHSLVRMETRQISDAKGMALCGSALQLFSAPFPWALRASVYMP